MLEYVTRTNVGNGRENNEDFCLASPEQNLWILADGVGGADAGEVASKLVCEAIMADIAGGQSAKEAIKAAHFLVKKSPALGLGKEGMASTVVVLLVAGDDCQISWVGDSRAYSWHPEQGLEQQTRDHSLVQQLVDYGVINTQDATTHPQRNLILQALGQSDLDDLEVGTVHRNISAGEKLLLCSDGLTDYVSDKVISDIFSQTDNEIEIADQLMDKALGNGGQDNVTITIVNLSPPGKQTTQGMKAKTVREGVRLANLRKAAPWLALIFTAVLATIFWVFR